jgi:tRNA-uridine 2-sulfurtransferase
MKVLVALSGGVDSAVAALLLKRQGYTLSAVYMRTWMSEEEDIVAECPWLKDMQEAQRVAEHLDIPFKMLNMVDTYKTHVVTALVEGYKLGLTPNPDIFCNQHVKFGALIDYALSEGFDYLATGHYCQRKTSLEGVCSLHEGKDPKKDQSYFLARVRYDRLQRALFPLGELYKKDVRVLAEEAGLSNARRKDSQGICFLGKVPINDFLKHYIPDQPGAIVDKEGKVLGEHLGLHRYTLGQRKHLNIPSNRDFENYVVLKKDYANNTLVIGFEGAMEQDLYQDSAQLESLHSLVHEPEWLEKAKSLPILARTRYQEPTQPVLWDYKGNGRGEVLFSRPQRALTPGQVLAFYRGDQLIVSGIYTV